MIFLSPLVLSAQEVDGHKMAPTFDPRQISAIEVRLWKAYYKKDYLRLFNESLLLIESQFDISREEALEIATPLAKAAYTFSQGKGDDDQNVLPELLTAYTKLKEATGAPFSPELVAQAELAWWTARRTPGQNSTENVARLMATLYGHLYGIKNEAIIRSATLRVQAAHIRDQSRRTGTPPDWEKIQSTLEESYSVLKEVLKN